MSFVYIKSSNCSWSSVHVLIRTPSCKVHIPVVELKLDVANRMSKVPTDHEAFGMCMSGNSLDIKELAAVILNPGEENQSGSRCMLVNDTKNLRRRKSSSGSDRLDSDHGIGWIEAMAKNLRVNGVLSNT